MECRATHLQNRVTLDQSSGFLRADLWIFYEKHATAC